MYDETYKMSFKELHFEIKEIFIRIKGTELRQSHLIPPTTILFNDNFETNYCANENNDNTKNIFCVRQALFSLEEEERKLIINEFYNSSPSWWMFYYSRSTYYRKQKKAMQLFLYFYRCSLC